MKTKSFIQKVIFRAKPEAVYNALIDSKKHSQFTESKAIVGKKAGDNFSAYDGYITGKNIELIPGKKIVQTWRTSDEGWPEGYYSTIEFVFKKTKEGTELQFTHSEIPSEVKADYEQGWEEYYWKLLKAFLEK